MQRSFGVYKASQCYSKSVVFVFLCVCVCVCVCVFTEEGKKMVMSWVQFHSTLTTQAVDLPSSGKILPPTRRHGVSTYHISIWIPTSFLSASFCRLVLVAINDLAYP